MKLNAWLRSHIERLEREIAQHEVFANDSPATPEQLRELRTKVVLHTYLKQQLLRRAPARYNTQEFELVLVKR